MGARIEPMTLSDLAEVLADHDRFWGGRDMRFLHQRVLVREFGDTCLTARGAGDRIAGYLIGFTTPRRVGYIHAVAVRDQARGTGCGRALYHAFAAVATAQGAEQLKAITTVTNAGSIAFHRRLGFDVRQVDSCEHDDHVERPVHTKRAGHLGRPSPRARSARCAYCQRT